MNKEKVIVNIDLTQKDENIELSSVHSADLMYVRAFAVHEGVNANNVRFRREVLLSSYETFVDKPVIIVPNRDNRPTGHGYSYSKKSFDKDKRKNIGHITNAFPVIVGEDESVTVVDNNNIDNLPDGELRIVVDMVIYKYYLGEIARQLEFLHNIRDFKFSMESLTYGVSEKDGIRDCESILFTGLATVASPAFEHSQSIAIAEEKEDMLMDFEQMYNDLKAKYDTLIASKNEDVEAELETTKTELASVKEDLANVKAELAEANNTVETLKPYKEKVEKSEKEALGKERAAKLAKFGVKEVNEMELAEKTPNEFADMLCEAADKMEIETVVAEHNKDILGTLSFNNSFKSDKDKLLNILTNLD